MNYRIYPEITPEEAARILGRSGAQVRQERRRTLVKAVARQMCLDMGRPVPGALL